MVKIKGFRKDGEKQKLYVLVAGYAEEEGPTSIYLYEYIGSLLSSEASLRY